VARPKATHVNSDEEALRLFEGHMAYALAQAKIFVKRSRRRVAPCDFEDLNNSALLGLWSAARKFDASKVSRRLEHPFGAYARYQIDYHLRDCMRRITGHKVGHQRGPLLVPLHECAAAFRRTTSTRRRPTDLSVEDIKEFVRRPADALAFELMAAGLRTPKIAAILGIKLGALQQRLYVARQEACPIIRDYLRDKSWRRRHA